MCYSLDRKKDLQIASPIVQRGTGIARDEEAARDVFAALLARPEAVRRERNRLVRIIDPLERFEIAVELLRPFDVCDWHLLHAARSCRVQREHHPARFEFAHDKITEAAGHRPFETAVAPMYFAIRACGLARDVDTLCERAPRALDVGRHRGHGADSAPPRKGIHRNLYRSRRRHISTPRRGRPRLGPGTEIAFSPSRQTALRVQDRAHQRGRDDVLRSATLPS